MSAPVIKTLEGVNEIFEILHSARIGGGGNYYITKKYKMMFRDTHFDGVLCVFYMTLKRRHAIVCVIHPLDFRYDVFL
ncbi:hypothetical protein Hanom_Chr15g01388581 [Helianthus anomalus]